MRPDLKICWFAVTLPGLQETCWSQIYYPCYAYPGVQSKLLVLSSASFFSCSCYFDLFYPLSSAQVPLDCATECRQINQWKASAAAISNTKNLEDFQM